MKEQQRKNVTKESREVSDDHKYRGVYFRGDYYPTNFDFYPEYHDMEEIEEFRVIGKTISYLVNMPKQLIVFSQGMVVTMTPDNYRKKRKEMGK